MKNINWRTSVLSVAILSLGASTGQAATQLAYANDTYDLNHRLLFDGQEAGDEILLAPGTANRVFSFEFQYYLLNPSGQEQARVRFYANDGTPYNGYATPGSTIWDSEWFSILGTQRSTLLFDDVNSPGLGSVVVPPSFTWTVQFQGHDTSDGAGVDLYSPARTGSSSPDFWYKTATGWELLESTATPPVPMDFAARLFTVPEPPSLAFAGVMLAGALWVVRRQKRAGA